MSRHLICPLCGKTAQVRRDGCLYVHAGDLRYLTRSGFAECRASGATYEEAREARARRDERRKRRQEDD